MFDERFIHFEEGKILFEFFQKYLPFKAPNNFWKSLKYLIFSIIKIPEEINLKKVVVYMKGVGGLFQALWTLSFKDSVYFDILHNIK